MKKRGHRKKKMPGTDGVNSASETKKSGRGRGIDRRQVARSEPSSAISIRLNGKEKDPLRP